MSLTTSGAKPPEQIELIEQGETGVEQLICVGPSIDGWVYRSQVSNTWHRVLPFAEVPLQRRTAIRAGASRLAIRAVAPIASLTGYYLVSYQVSGIFRTLGEILVQPDPLARIGHVLKVLRRMEAWREMTGGPLLLMPSDVLFGDDGVPVLLALPFWRLPQVEVALVEPTRILYLAPELVRGSVGGDSQALDRYAIGAILLDCFRNLPTTLNPAEALLRAANGTLFAAQLQSKLPFWMERIRATELALVTVRNLLVSSPATRRSVPWETLAQELESCRKGMDAIGAVTEMRQMTGGDKAFALLQDILLFQESYDLLLLGSDIAAYDLGRPLAAAELLERAIAKHPERPEAYLAHFKVVTRTSEDAAFPSLAQVFEQNAEAATLLDADIQRDLSFFHDEQRADLDELWAEYLLERGQFERAAQIIYPHLFENGTYAFWKFHLNCLYAAALMGQDRFDEAEQQLGSIANGLSLVTQNHTVPIEEIHLWADWLEELRREWLIRRNPSAYKAPSGRPSH